MRSPGLDRWTAHAPLGACLLLALLSTGCVRAVAARADHWWSVRTAHVHLETDADRGRAIAEADRLEDLHRGLVASFYDCTEHQDDLVEVTILANEAESRQLFPNEAGVSLSPHDGLLAMPRRIVTSTAALGDLGGRQIVAHELAHGFVASCFPSAPAWLHEGLASVFETLAVPEADTAVIGYPSSRVTGTPFFRTSYEPEDMVVRVVPIALLPPPSALVGMPAEAFYHPPVSGLTATWQRGRAGTYAAATQLAYLLALGPSADLRARFVRYLRALRAGRDQDVAFESAFAGVDLDRALARFLADPDYEVHERRLPPSDSLSLRAERVSRAEAHLLLAEVEYQAHAEVSADVLSHLARAERDPAWRPHALLLRATMEPWQPRRLVEDAAALAPDDLDVLRARAVLALRTDDWPGMAAIAEHMEARSDLRPSDAVVLADVEGRLGHFDRAEARVSDVLRSDRSALGAWVVLGRIALLRGDRDTARQIATAMRTVVRHRSSEEVRASLAELDHALDETP